MEDMKFARQLERELNAALNFSRAIKNADLETWTEAFAQIDAWKACAEELAEMLSLHYRFMPDHDTKMILDKFNNLKSK